MIVRTFTATDDALATALGLADHHRGRHHSAGVHLRACRLHGRMLDEMPMDDATASDNCGEVTIEVSSETTAGDAAGNYVIVRTFTATDDAGTALGLADHHRGRHHGAGVHLRACRLHGRALTRCPWTTPRRRTTAEKSPSRCHETTAAMRRQLRDRSHLHRHRRCWQQRSASQTITVETPRRRSSPSACRLHGRML